MEAIAAETDKSKRSVRPLPVRPIAITLAQAKKISGLGTTKLYQLMSSGQLESRTVGRRRLILLMSLERLLGV